MNVKYVYHHFTKEKTGDSGRLNDLSNNGVRAQT